MVSPTEKWSYFTKATCEIAIIYTQNHSKKIGWSFIGHTYKYKRVSGLRNHPPSSIVSNFSPGNIFPYGYLQWILSLLTQHYIEQIQLNLNSDRVTEFPRNIC